MAIVLEVLLCVCIHLGAGRGLRRAECVCGMGRGGWVPAAPDGYAFKGAKNQNKGWRLVSTKPKKKRTKEDWQNSRPAATDKPVAPGQPQERPAAAAEQGHERVAAPASLAAQPVEVHRHRGQRRRQRLLVVHPIVVRHIQHLEAGQRRHLGQEAGQAVGAVAQGVVGAAKAEVAQRVQRAGRAAPAPRRRQLPAGRQEGLAGAAVSGQHAKCNRKQETRYVHGHPGHAHRPAGAAGLLAACSRLEEVAGPSLDRGVCQVEAEQGLQVGPRRQAAQRVEGEAQRGEGGQARRAGRQQL